MLEVSLASIIVLHPVTEFYIYPYLYAKLQYVIDRHMISKTQDYDVEIYYQDLKLIERLTNNNSPSQDSLYIPRIISEQQYNDKLLKGMW